MGTGLKLNSGRLAESRLLGRLKQSSCSGVVGGVILIGECVPPINRNERCDRQRILRVRTSERRTHVDQEI